MPTIKNWFEQYVGMPVQDLKKIKAELKPEDLQENQMTGLDLAIVTIERNPDYSALYVVDKQREEEKKLRKGKYVAVKTK